MFTFETPIEVVEQGLPETTKLPPLPNGYYKAIAEEQGLLDTKAGKMLKYQFQITAPHEYEKRKVWNNYNIIHTDVAVMKRSEKELGKFGWAIGIQALRKPEELLYKEVTLELEIVPEKPKDKNDPSKGVWEISNRIIAYYPASWSRDQIEDYKNTKKSEGGSAPAPAVPSAPSGDKPKPWAKK